MKWVKCSERMPERFGKYSVLIEHPGTPECGFFKATPATKEIDFAIFTQKEIFLSQDENTITYTKVNVFKSIFGDAGWEIKNITHWLECSFPEEE